MNRELPDVQDGFRKGKGARDQIVNIHWIIEKARELKKKTKTMIHSFTDYEKTSDCVDTNKVWKILKEMDYQTTLPVS